VFAPKRWGWMWLAFVVFKAMRSMRSRRTETIRKTIKEGEVFVISNKKVR